MAVLIVIGSVIALICILRRNKVSSEKAEQELEDEIKRAGTMGVKIPGDLSKSPSKNRAALMHKVEDLEGQARQRDISDNILVQNYSAEEEKFDQNLEKEGKEGKGKGMKVKDFESVTP